MEDARIYKKIELVNPVMIAGWPGMGSVALGVVDYLRKNLAVTKFAEIKVDPLTTMDSVAINKGLATLPPNPQNVFYFAKDPDLIIFEGETQVPGAEGINLLNKALDLAEELKVARIYTGAAFPVPISHKEASEIYGAANKKALVDFLRKFGLNLMEEGHISGLNGLMLGLAAKRGIEAVCLLATMPQYAISLPNPKASYAIIETLKRMLGFNIDLREMEEYIKDMDEKMSIVEDKVKDVLTIEKEEPDPHPTEKKIPGYIMEKIEKLFHEAHSDKARAIALKKELDRWDLYKRYEDRFLDLFKNNG